MSILTMMPSKKKTNKQKPLKKKKEEKERERKKKKKEKKNMISSKCTLDQVTKSIPCMVIFLMYAVTIHGSDYTAQ